MSKRKTAAEHLASAPEPVRRVMLAASRIEPGAAAVVGRFFAALRARGEALDNPSRTTFEAAAASESTLATLLRALAIYAPMVSTCAGREIRRGYYRARSGGAGQGRRKGAAPLPPVAPEIWPVVWHRLYPGLILARGLKDTSKRRHIASINRCAAVLRAAGLEVDGAPDFLLAFTLAERFRAAGLKHCTVSSYLQGLVALGRHGKAPVADTDGVAYVAEHHLTLADMETKKKEARLAVLRARGGFGFIAEVTADLRDRADDLPAHTAAFLRLRQQAALLGVHINKPGRTGDVSAWQIGKELQRLPDGIWELHWSQGKSGHETGAGRLWEEVSQLIDELILGGRPDRLVHLRYEALLGKNWLTLSNEAPASGWPSELIKEAIGLPSHDLRTLVADELRFHDPARAPDVIQTHLGHSTREASDPYRSYCESDVAARKWAEIRCEIAAGALER